MKDETLTKLTAIVGLIVLEAINLLTLKVDGGILLAIGSIIGGLAGYEVGKRGKK